MDWSRLDTRWWNLSFGVAATSAITAMTACGPTIALDDGGETITDSDGETDSETTPTTEPPPVECISSSDCDPGWECIDNACVYYDYCADGGCCYDDCCYDDCCYGECYYYECYEDGDCGVGGLCGDFGECSFVELVADCPDPVELLPLPIAETGSDDVVSLSFVDADGDGPDELVIARESGQVELVRNGAEGLELSPLPFPEDAPVTGVVAAELTGDGLVDLAGATADGRLITLEADGAGGWAPISEASTTSSVRQLATLDWNADGLTDLVVLGEDSRVDLFLGNGAASYLAIHELNTGAGARDIVAGDFGADAFGDVVVQGLERGMVFWGNAVDDLQPDSELGLSIYGPRGLVGADFDGGGVDDLVGHTAIETWSSTWTMLEAWRDGFGEQPPVALDAPAFLADASGDVDGDGRPDVVTLGESTLSIVRGNPDELFESIFACADRIGLEDAPERLTVGDFDGDGRSEIAVAGPGGVTLLTPALPE